MEPRRSRKFSNEPNIPKLTQLEELTIDVTLLAKALSKVKYYAESCRKHMSEEELNVIRKYAR